MTDRIDHDLQSLRNAKQVVSKSLMSVLPAPSQAGKRALQELNSCMKHNKYELNQKGHNGWVSERKCTSGTLFPHCQQICHIKVSRCKDRETLCFHLPLASDILSAAAAQATCTSSAC